MRTNWNTRIVGEKVIVNIPTLFKKLRVQIKAGDITFYKMASVYPLRCVYTASGAESGQRPTNADATFEAFSHSNRERTRTRKTVEAASLFLAVQRDGISSLT